MRAKRLGKIDLTYDQIKDMADNWRMGDILLYLRCSSVTVKKMFAANGLEKSYCMGKRPRAAVKPIHVIITPGPTRTEELRAQCKAINMAVKRPCITTLAKALGCARRNGVKLTPDAIDRCIEVVRRGDFEGVMG